jgi:hypothetical protein
VQLERGAEATAEDALRCADVGEALESQASALSVAVRRFQLGTGAAVTPSLTARAA